MNTINEHHKFLEHYAFLRILGDVIDGHEVAPRGLKIKELNNYTYTLPPFARLMNFESRKLNLDYIKREFLWYLKGDRYDTSICDHARMWIGLINGDGSINSNYGQYVFGEQQQFWRVVKTLEDDKDSRRASIMILNHEHLDSDTKDVPCTYAINFRIRDNKLHMTVHMRSQDAIFGMGNDAPAFSFIHEMMWQALKVKYEDLEYGDYFHVADSFHVYERHFEMMEKIVRQDDPFVPINVPRISGIEEVEFLSVAKFNDIPDEFEFTKWLHTYDK